ncbi:ABC transporter permease [Cellulomonas fimi]|uniref:ABC-2 type transporter n=1 Tax=Cellulomonas fimi (strain ATCC 484 / DSM 20113 / JCM 1341 / CCUG 24087 / LMG 16345 / NBRC 15513 / NCIMB 8980 / NCTC 7547 / NRS-133) TaxID=590998 RepID=F4H6D7_CELFA|nr:ABC transporter permease [Cellulomonas fimi]AEE44449.1 ABC-2 type transporter [Cellulomonas fimi ATCC 484]NNH06651.1 ABC transporter permease [Cellulomonas fimi]VEH26385.1 daunorubicin resistance ABC transporter membrane protein [Cellulomonas fimi]
MLGSVWAGARLQGLLVRRNPETLLLLFTSPFVTVAILSVFADSGRTGLMAMVVLAPVLMALVQMGLFVGGEIVTTDRETGVLEAATATPAPFAWVLVGRVLTVTAVSLVAFVECLATARLVFGVVVTVHDPVRFAAATLGTTAATAATSLLAAALFVAVRSARTYQNALPYPLFVLSGVVVPVALLPAWVEPVSRVVFLRWSADALRASVTATTADDSWAPIVYLGLLSVVTAGAGYLLVERVLLSGRRHGRLTFA